MSSSSTSKASVYGSLPLPPGTSASWIPPSSLYCCHRSVSRISAAARNLRIDASPLDREPLLSSRSWANTDELSDSSPAPMVAAPATANPFFMNERRPTASFISFSGCFTRISFRELDCGSSSEFDHSAPDSQCHQATSSAYKQLSCVCRSFVICLHFVE